MSETSEYEIRTDRAKRFAKIWTTSRADAGKTQEYMAKGLGVSKKTIQNWENAVTSPSLFDGSEWFRVLGMNPLPYYLAFLFPESFDGIEPDASDEAIEKALMLLIKNSTSVEKRELLYLMAGQHGSPWYSLLQLFTAHCHTSMHSRVNAARLVLENYEIEEKTGKLVCPDNIRPDIEMLRNAVDMGREAAVSSSPGYTNIVKPQE